MAIYLIFRPDNNGVLELYFTEEKDPNDIQEKKIQQTGYNEIPENLPYFDGSKMKYNGLEVFWDDLYECFYYPDPKTSRNIMLPPEAQTILMNDTYKIIEVPSTDALRRQTSNYVIGRGGSFAEKPFLGDNEVIVMRFCNHKPFPGFRARDNNGRYKVMANCNNAVSYFKGLSNAIKEAVKYQSDIILVNNFGNIKNPFMIIGRSGLEGKILSIKENGEGIFLYDNIKHLTVVSNTVNQFNTHSGVMSEAEFARVTNGVNAQLITMK